MPEMTHTHLVDQAPDAVIFAGADGRSHGLFHQARLTRAGADGRVAHGTFFHFGHTRGNADDHARPGRAKGAVAVHLADEVVNHLLGDVEV